MIQHQQYCNDQTCEEEEGEEEEEEEEEEEVVVLIERDSQRVLDQNIFFFQLQKWTREHK